MQDTRSDIDKVLEATDLVALIGEAIPLRAKGREHVGLCPFHDDHKPSFAVVTHKDVAFYKCFACGASGTAMQWMMNFHKMEFRGALEYLAKRAGIELHSRGGPPRSGEADSPDALRRASVAAMRYFERVLADEALGAVGRKQLDERRVAPAMREAFHLGLAAPGGTHFLQFVRKFIEHGKDSPDSPRIESFVAAGLLRERNGELVDGFRNRVIFPILDELGRPLAFGARRINPDDEPKYLNSPESSIFHKSKSLFGMHLAKRAIIDSRTAVVVEGYTDVIACHEAGFDNVVATLGTALTRDHARVLSRLCDRVVLLFDGDEAGRRAADRGLDVVFAQPIDVSVATIPGGRDPDELLRDADGPAAFREVIDQATDALRHLAESLRAALEQASGPGGRQKAVEAMIGRLAQNGLADLPTIRQRMVLDSIANVARIPVATLEAALPRRSSAVIARPATASAATTVATAPIAAPPATPIGRAQRIAEESLLAVLLAHPELCQERLPSADGESLSLTEQFPPERFHGEAERDIYSLIHARVEAGESFSLSTLLADLPDDLRRARATDLFLLGERRCESEGGPRGRLIDAVADMESMAARLCSDASSADDTSSAMARLDAIRSNPIRPAAIARTTPTLPLSPA